MAVARLSPQDAEAFRSLRLEALRQAPLAFGSTLAEEASRPLSWFGDTLESSAVFAASGAEGRLLGMLGYRAESLRKRQHIGQLWGLYVRPEARGLGIGAGLLDACISHARARVSVLQLLAGAANPDAIRLYERAGFTLLGTEPASLRVDGVDAATLIMMLRLD